MKTSNATHLINIDGTRITRSIFKQIPVSYKIPGGAVQLGLVRPDRDMPMGTDWLVFSTEKGLWRSEQPPYLNKHGDDKLWQPREEFSKTNRDGAMDVHVLHFHNWRNIASKTTRKYL